MQNSFSRLVRKSILTKLLVSAPGKILKIKLQKLRVKGSFLSEIDLADSVESKNFLKPQLTSRSYRKTLKLLTKVAFNESAVDKYIRCCALSSQRKLRELSIFSFVHNIPMKETLKSIHLSQEKFLKKVNIIPDEDTTPFINTYQRVLSSLVSLEQLYIPEFPKDFHRADTRTLRTLKNIKTLQIPPTTTLADTIKHWHNLKRIKISFIENYSPEQAARILNALSLSENLEEAAFDFPEYELEGLSNQFHGIVSKFIRNKPNLKHLGLDFSPFSFLRITKASSIAKRELVDSIASLRYLKTLSLRISQIDESDISSLKLLLNARFTKTLQHFDFNIGYVKNHIQIELEKTLRQFFACLENPQSIVIRPPFLPDWMKPKRKTFFGIPLPCFLQGKPKSENSKNVNSNMLQEISFKPSLTSLEFEPFKALRCSKELLVCFESISKLVNLRKLTLSIRMSKSSKKSFNKTFISSAVSCFEKLQNLEDIRLISKALPVDFVFKLLFPCKSMKKILLDFSFLFWKKDKKNPTQFDEQGLEEMKKTLANMKKLDSFRMVADFRKIQAESIIDMFNFLKELKLKECVVRSKPSCFSMETEDEYLKILGTLRV